MRVGPPIGLEVAFGQSESSRSLSKSFLSLHVEQKATYTTGIYWTTPNKALEPTSGPLAADTSENGGD